MSAEQDLVERMAKTEDVRERVYTQMETDQALWREHIAWSKEEGKKQTALLTEIRDLLANPMYHITYGK